MRVRCHKQPSVVASRHCVYNNSTIERVLLSIAVVSRNMDHRCVPSYSKYRLFHLPKPRHYYHWNANRKAAADHSPTFQQVTLNYTSTNIHIPFTGASQAPQQ